MSLSRLLPFHLSTSQKVIVISVTAGVAVLGVIASYLGRRRTSKPQQRRLRKPGGRKARNSVRSPNDIISLAGSKASGRSYSPGGSIHGVSDRLSLASGSLAVSGSGMNAGQVIGASTPLTPQQLGVMGMEALDSVISYWEEALAGRNDIDIPSRITADQEEFCRELQNLLDAAYNLQEQGELLFLDERSVLFRDEENRKTNTGLLSNGHRSGSDPNFDSAESFASALDQVADLREFEDYGEVFSDVENYPLYQDALELLNDNPIPCRTTRTDMVGCTSDSEHFAKLHCIRLAFQFLFKDPKNSRWVADSGRQVLTDLLCLGDKDPKDFLVAYESMLEFLQNADNWPAIELELYSCNVKAITFYDVVLDFIILDAFRDLDSPPNSVLAVINNRFLSNSFKETALTTAVWSVLKAKKRLLKFPSGIMSHFYCITEQLSPLMVWGFFGPDEDLKEVCKYFKDQMMGFMVDIYNFQKCRYTTVEELAEDILSNMRMRVNNIGVKFNQ
ncbi:mitoguardin [Toxorhynchites rutilus septentrionalis]|uniref:mitoguardin n=1 Tax=Toxorhynchites rutilus septentrionalis TaxID=329112 RepID=UPI00247ADB37|nr:mitoguardin [Toxorhynchites rutilus septentrionalis]